MSRGGWSRYGRAPLAARAAVALTITLAFLLVPALLDSWGYHHLYRPNLYDLDWARFLRLMGWWPTWVLIGSVIWLNGHEEEIASGRAPVRMTARRRAGLLIWSTAGSGILAEIVKLLIRRTRPEFGDGEWIFRPWDERTFSTAGLATPSSHTMVAFAGATMAARLFPRARWVFYALAWGCGFTRILSHAHYVSDVTFGALLGWAVGWGFWIQWGGCKKAKADLPTTGEPVPQSRPTL